MAYNVVNETLIKRNWLLGMRIQKEILNGQRAEYGELIVKTLAKSLTMQYGEGFTKTNLYNYIGFFQKWPDFFHAVSGISEGDKNIFHAVSGKSRSLLSWTHYRILLQVDNDEAREWYATESLLQAWSSRTLQRNISSQYYFRRLASHNKSAVEQEMLMKTAALQDKLEFIKSPVVAEFLGFSNRTDYTETELETALINHLQQFLMELGKGYAFISRQQHIQTEKEDYYIDLVFYNYLLKCFVLIDLKSDKISYQDVGQMDMYVKMYDELKRTDGDNPTIGILLCADTDEDVARYSMLNGSEQLFATKYLTYLPSKDELRREIEQQKQHFMLTHQK
jgi:predicted nuclease of restriction endonuclease-like (RecB) superfamily